VGLRPAGSDSLMRDLRELDAWRDRSRRIIEYYGSAGDGTCGAFNLPHGGQLLRCIASSDGGWDHVSVSLDKRCPSWSEMDYAKRRFFKDDEVAMQLHVAVADHISLHPFCLHLWRPHGTAIPLPPRGFVA
jgi:hypothetical protein